MTKHDVAILAAKILGIYYVVSSFTYLQGFAMQLTFASGVPGAANTLYIFVLTFISFSATIGIGFLLFFYSGRAAIIFLGREENAPQVIAVDLHSLQIVAFSVLGLGVIMNSLPRISRACLMFLIPSLMSDRGTRFTITMLTELGVGLVELGAGCWLLFGSAGISTAIEKLRNAGVDETLEEPDEDRKAE
jgi:hypothetical protein